MIDRERRARAAQICVDRYLGQPLQWGRRDCCTLARTAMHQMGVGVPFLKGVRWSSARSAMTKMRALGFADLVEAVDGTGLAEIPPASAWAGDIIALPAPDDNPFGCALTLAVGNGRVLGFGEGVEGAAILQPKSYLKAWRVG